MSAHWLEVFAIAALVWAVRAYFFPYAPCRWCSGRKVRRGSTKKRFGLCPHCKGSGSRQVLGSKSVHRAVRSARSAWSSRRG